MKGTKNTALHVAQSPSAVCVWIPPSGFAGSQVFSLSSGHRRLGGRPRRERPCFNHLYRCITQCVCFTKSENAAYIPRRQVSDSRGGPSFSLRPQIRPPLSRHGLLSGYEGSEGRGGPAGHLGSTLNSLASCRFALRRYALRGPFCNVLSVAPMGQPTPSCRRPCRASGRTDPDPSRIIGHCPPDSKRPSRDERRGPGDDRNWELGTPCQPTTAFSTAKYANHANKKGN